MQISTEDKIDFGAIYLAKPGDSKLPPRVSKIRMRY